MILGLLYIVVLYGGFRMERLCVLLGIVDFMIFGLFFIVIYVVLGL